MDNSHGKIFFVKRENLIIGRGFDKLDSSGRKRLLLLLLSILSYPIKLVALFISRSAACPGKVRSSEISKRVRSVVLM